MYISEVSISNFRKFGNKPTVFNFRKGINIIIGENNTGKTSLIDALLLAMQAGNYQKSRYISVYDFHVNNYGERAKEINISIFLEDLTEEQGVSFYKLTDGKDASKAEIHITYLLSKNSKGNYRVRDSIKGGPIKASIEREIFENINLLFLPALRDVNRDMKPSKMSVVASILNSIVETEDEKERLLSKLLEANDKIKTDDAIQNLQKNINRNLKLIEQEELQQEVSVNLIDPTFDSILGSLDISYNFDYPYMKIGEEQFEQIIEDSGVDEGILEDTKLVRKEGEIYKLNIEKIKEQEHLIPLYQALCDNRSSQNFNLSQNGLGYNNILSMAASLVDLQKKPVKEEFSVLLVEEPEAHLHPQLLDLLFGFFKKSNIENDIQILLTSHSPTLIAKSDINSLHVIFENNKKIESRSLALMQLTEDEKEDLSRYLDVTKSQMFFAKRIVFVEGISEAILISEFAKLLQKPLDKYSVEIVNIGGVAFEPFAKLYQDKSGSLICPCAIISDDDKCTNSGDTFQIHKNELTYNTANIDEINEKLKKGSISYRAMNLLDFNKNNISVNLANKTLEYELASIKDNNDLLLEILDPLHPEICKDIKAKIEGGEDQKKIAIRLWLGIRDCKGVFAQRLACQISKIVSGEREGSVFKVPQYIEDAINSIIP